MITIRIKRIMIVLVISKSLIFSNNICDSNDYVVNEDDYNVVMWLFLVCVYLRTIKTMTLIKVDFLHYVIIVKWISFVYNSASCLSNGTLIIGIFQDIKYSSIGNNNNSNNANNNYINNHKFIIETSNMKQILELTKFCCCKDFL